MKEQFSGSCYDAAVLAPEDEWIGHVDRESFRTQIRRIGKELAEQQGTDDYKHLQKMICWSRACTILGLCTMWWRFNVISVFLLSLGTMTRWTIVGHHVCHGGFDKCSGGRYNRFTFGVGSLARRCYDWLDWMLVEAWNVEHNQLHHYHLGETSDPDLVENNLRLLREARAPRWVKYAAAAAAMLVWKWFYYSPNTFKTLAVQMLRRQGKMPTFPPSHARAGQKVPPHWMDAAWVLEPAMLWGETRDVFFRVEELLVRVLGPYFIARFVLLPLAFALCLGRAAGANALSSLVCAELLTNAHAFLNIVTNHAGDDLYRFERHCTPRSGTFYLRQVISSTNFPAGGDLNDFLHGWLNYQIEHHLWPDLSMLSYRRAQPLVKQLCKEHGIPYVQQSVFARLKKTLDVMVGATSMRKFPSAWEVEADMADDCDAGKHVMRPAPT